MPLASNYLSPKIPPSGSANTQLETVLVLPPLGRQRRINQSIAPHSGRQRLAPSLYLGTNTIVVEDSVEVSVMMVRLITKVNIMAAIDDFLPPLWIHHYRLLTQF